MGSAASDVRTGRVFAVGSFQLAKCGRGCTSSQLGGRVEPDADPILGDSGQLSCRADESARLSVGTWRGNSSRTRGAVTQNRTGVVDVEGAGDDSMLRYLALRKAGSRNTGGVVVDCADGILGGSG